MKKKDLIQFKVKSIEELKKLAIEKEKELVKKAADIFSGKGKDVKIARKLRKEIAQIKTILREKEITEVYEKVVGKVEGGKNK